MSQIFDISNYELCQVKQFKFEISKVYARHQGEKIQGLEKRIFDYCTTPLDYTSDFNTLYYTHAILSRLVDLSASNIGEKNTEIISSAAMSAIRCSVGKGTVDQNTEIGIYEAHERIKYKIFICGEGQTSDPNLEARQAKRISARLE